MIDFYKITLGENTYYFNDSFEQIEVDGNLYTPAPIKRKEFVYELDKQNLVITVPAKLYPFSTLLKTKLFNVFKVEIFSEDFIEQFTGTVASLEVDYKKGTIDLQLNSIFINLESVFPKRTYGKTCPYTFCDKNCKAQNNAATFIPFCNNCIPEWFSFKIEGNKVISDILKWEYLVIYVHDNAYNLSLRIVNGTFTTEFGESFRVINWDSNEGIVVLEGSPILTEKLSSATLNFYCNKSTDFCDALYDNIENYGGFPFIPESNPAIYERF